MGAPGLLLNRLWALILVLNRFGGCFGVSGVVLGLVGTCWVLWRVAWSPLRGRTGFVSAVGGLPYRVWSASCRARGCGLQLLSRPWGRPAFVEFLPKGP